jgi:hypothetical protein
MPQAAAAAAATAIAAAEPAAAAEPCCWSLKSHSHDDSSYIVSIFLHLVLHTESFPCCNKLVDIIDDLRTDHRLLVMAKHPCPCWCWQNKTAKIREVQELSSLAPVLQNMNEYALRNNQNIVQNATTTTYNQ